MPLSPNSLSTPAVGDKRTYYDPFEQDVFKKRAIEIQNQAQAVRITGGRDEYAAWCANESQQMVYCHGPLQYWHSLRFKYPRLSEIALEFLTVQPMSAECERLFSAARKMMTNQRLSLDAMIVGICQVLRSWYRSGLIPKLDTGLVELAEREAIDALMLIPEEGGQQKNAATA
ncbi:hypothetical protein TruAng_006666 [Truncatella angustata]|nr:hypothetical protein TruAng_006666 [Truncatella angustata]